jgi:hypothetical protein
MDLQRKTAKFRCVSKAELGEVLLREAKISPALKHYIGSLNISYLQIP